MYPSLVPPPVCNQAFRGPATHIQTPPPAICMVNGGVEGMSGDPDQGHPCLPRRAGRSAVPVPVSLPLAFRSSKGATEQDLPNASLTYSDRAVPRWSLCEALQRERRILERSLRSGDGPILQHAALVGLGEHGLDGVHELSRRLHAQFHSHAGARAEGLVDEIDVQRVLERQVVRMVVGYIGFADLEPLRAA